MPSVLDRIKAIQRRLGVAPDGIIGPVTLSRIEALLDAAEAPSGGETPAPEASLVVSRDALEALVGFEISSEAYYRRHLQSPIWPGAASGVTIGIGYDLGHTSATQLERDWRGRLPDTAVDALLSVQGLKGEAAKRALSKVRHVVVPLPEAKQVFYTSTLPRFAKDTRRVYEGVEKLPPDAQGALLSLVFNRGTSMANTSSRREMRAIRDLVKAKNLAGIAAQIRAMKRLWDRSTLPGLHVRRDREADLVAGADRPYTPEEKVSV